MNVSWIEKESENDVYLSSDLANQHALKDAEVQFGQLIRKVSVKISKVLPANTIHISKSIFKPYTIPTNLPYEIVIHKNRIKLGPVIGIVISYKRFFNHQEYVGRTHEYTKIKGLLFICRPNTIDFEKNSISGYYFNPHGKTKSTQWIEGTFPFPNVMYNRRMNLQEKIYNQLTQGKVQVFNSHYINKWEQFELFSQKANLQSYLPETLKLTKSSLAIMLEKHEEIYVKPTKRANGSGIKLIKKSDQGFLLIENDSSQKNYKTVHSLFKAIQKRNTILQQSVAFKTDNRNVDFRVCIQKDQSTTWKHQGISCKVSKENSIITNAKGRDAILTGLESLITIYQLPYDEAKRKENEMFQLCQKLAESIEENGIHLGDVAFDIIIDSNLQLWVLESQIRYQAFSKEEHEYEFYYKTMTTPMYYAKALAGF